jgi:uncharacterized surface protein with fasciclin (FAS1) repeats
MLFAATGLIFLASCDKGGDPEPKATETLMQLIDSQPNLDSLKKYIQFAPKVVEKLNAAVGSEGTFFAPNNAAFQNLIASISGGGDPLPLESVNPTIMIDVLEYHFSSMQYTLKELTAGTPIGTLQGEEIGIAIVNDEPTLLTGSTTANIAIVSEVKGTNGVMLVTGSVLIPPTWGARLVPLLGTNGGTIMLGADFSSLAYGIQKADTFATVSQLPTIISRLIGTADNTVFAPVNPVFEIAAAGAGVTVPQYLAGLSGQSWYGLILNHIVMDDVAGSAITTGVPLTTALTADGVNFNVLLPFVDATGGINPDAVGRIYLDGNGDVDLAAVLGGDPSTLANLDGYVAVPDASVTSNGRVHAFAGVLAPPQ